MAGAYRHIGVASTFSPRFQAVLAEADRFARRFDGPLSVIHAAAEHPEGAAKFAEALSRLRREEKSTVLWSVADTPTDAILAACVRGGIDLLLAGALEREGDYRNFVGGVARELLQRAPCDLLLLPKPEEQAAPCACVAVEVDLKKPSVALLNRACEIATRLEAKEMIFIGIVTPFDEARIAAGGEQLDEARLASIVDQASGFEGEVDCRLLRSTTGFSVCDFLQDAGAGLFIAGLRRKDGQRRLPTRLDWLLQVIPTNVLLVGIDD
ncbi:MAG: universal stress protein [Terrimicrobiaceae bacterium]|nr:universal stress protein [Terrimicrobiaceae bacterium]